MHLVDLFGALDGSKTSYYWVYHKTINMYYCKGADKCKKPSWLGDRSLGVVLNVTPLGLKVKTEHYIALMLI
jgi:hypothetical protein